MKPTRINLDVDMASFMQALPVAILLIISFHGFIGPGIDFL